MGCGGKKNLFPARRLVFAEVRKSEKEKKADEEAYNKYMKERRKNNITKDEEEELKSIIKPKKRKYIYQGEDNDFEGLEPNYPFNWYIGGVDTCQGDSGGPLWRNVKTKNGTRATQLGVVARGSYCAWFNSPGIYTRVSYLYDWIKTTIEQEAGGEDMCKIKEKNPKNRSNMPDSTGNNTQTNTEANTQATKQANSRVIKREKKRAKREKKRAIKRIKKRAKKRTKKRVNQDYMLIPYYSHTDQINGN